MAPVVFVVVLLSLWLVFFLYRRCLFRVARSLVACSLYSNKGKNLFQIAYFSGSSSLLSWAFPETFTNRNPAPSDTSTMR